MAGIRDIGASAGGTCTARRYVGDNGNITRQYCLDDIPHRGIESAGCIHSKNNDAGIRLLGLVKATQHIVAGSRANGTVDIDNPGFTRDLRRHLYVDQNGQQDKKTEKALVLVSVVHSPDIKAQSIRGKVTFRSRGKTR